MMQILLHIYVDFIFTEEDKQSSIYIVGVWDRGATVVLSHTLTTLTTTTLNRRDYICLMIMIQLVSRQRL